MGGDQDAKLANGCASRSQDAADPAQLRCGGFIRRRDLDGGNERGYQFAQLARALALGSVSKLCLRKALERCAPGVSLHRWKRFGPLPDWGAGLLELGKDVLSDTRLSVLVPIVGHRKLERRYCLYLDPTPADFGSRRTPLRLRSS